MPADEIEVLCRWGRGDFYPLAGDERGALDDLADKMSEQPDKWWQAFRELITEADRATTQNLIMPFGALLTVSGERIWELCAEAAHMDRKTADAFWNAMNFAMLSGEAYRLLGRQATIEAFVRHEPRIPSQPGEPWPDQWEDEWSGDALFYLTEHDPDEAWTVALDLLAIKDDPRWASTIVAFIIEDLLHDHGDAFIDRIEAEAARNERLRMALPTARWRVPDHLIERFRVAAGR